MGKKDESEDKKKDTKTRKKRSKDKNMKDRKEDNNKKRKKKKFGFNKIYLFAFLNLIALVILVYLLSASQKKALKLRELINAQQNAQQSNKVNLADLEIKSNQEKADRIISLFPNDQGLLDFIQIIEDKSENGTVVNFSFASKEPVRDSTTNLGVPVVINFRGSWEEIDRDLRDIQNAPFLFRPITIEASVTAEENVIEFMYGGFLYVDEDF